MNNLIPFIIKSSISLAVLYTYYNLVLRRTTNYEINRFYLLFSLLFSLCIPFISFNIGKPEVYTETAPIMNVLLDEIRVVANYNTTVNTNNPIITVITTLYITGVIFLAAKLIYGLYSIRYMINKNNKSRDDEYQIVRLNGLSTSFSFFRYIFIGDVHSTTNEDISKIIAHEKVHSEQLHSIDVILVEIATILLWANPLIWLLRKAIKDNHEYIADNEVIKKYPAGSYLQLLLNQTTKARISYGNCFAYSNLKKRMIMISKKTSGKYSLMSYIPAVLTVVALFIGFSCTNEAVEEKTKLDDDIKVVEITKTEDGIIIKSEDGREFKINNEDGLEALKKFNIIGKKDLLLNKKGDSASKEYYSDEVFVVVENMPEFPGGNMALMKFIANNVKYPTTAQKKGVSGRVFVGFVIDKDGSVTNVKVLRPVDPDLDKEAIRVVKSMPKWKPGKQRGHTVKVSYTVPINFSLK